MRSGELAGEKVTRQSGFTLIGLLFLVSVLGLLLALVGRNWQTAVAREKEAQLLFVGDQYRLALTAYYQSTPGSDKVYPKKLEDLLIDPRFPNTVRHLRRLWQDPVGGGEWVLLRDERGGIKGLHSPSSSRPRKIAGFPKQDLTFEGAGHYSDWVFATVVEATH